MSIVAFAADLVAITVLVFAIYLPRHRRPDLMVAFLAVNIGVLAVSATLIDNSALGAGLGLGLFGVLSIIRLRSEEIGHREVAYFFSALALGLIGGLGSATPQTVGLMAAIVVVIAIADHPAVYRSYDRQLVQLDHAEADVALLAADLATRLDARILNLDVIRVDFVDDTTLVDVRFARAGSGKRKAAAASGESGGLR